MDSKKIKITDCFDYIHFINTENIKEITSFYNNNAKKSITIIHLIELTNNLLDVRTYESEFSVKRRLSNLQ